MSEENEKKDEALQRIAIDTMLGDLRDAVLDSFKHEKDIKPWKDMSEQEQRELVERIEYRCRCAIRQAVGLIASNGFKTVKGELEKVTIKDSYQCVINVSKYIEERHALADAAGGVILLTVANDEEFMGADAAEVDPDQPDLPIADSCSNIPNEDSVEEYAEDTGSVLDDDGPDALDEAA